MSTPYTDKIVALASGDLTIKRDTMTDKERYDFAAKQNALLPKAPPGIGHVRSYERFEHGKEERVGGYMSHLQGQLASWRAGAGKMAPASWGLVGDETRKELTAPGAGHDGQAVQHHMRGAVTAIDNGNKAEAVGHLFTAAMEARDRGLPHEELLHHANGLRHDMGMRDIP